MEEEEILVPNTYHRTILLLSLTIKKRPVTWKKQKVLTQQIWTNIYKPSIHNFHNYFSDNEPSPSNPALVKVRLLEHWAARQHRTWISPFQSLLVICSSGPGPHISLHLSGWTKNRKLMWPNTNTRDFLNELKVFVTCLSAGVPQGQFTTDEGLDLLGSGWRTERSVPADDSDISEAAGFRYSQV